MMSSMAWVGPGYIKDMAEGLVLLCRWKLKKKVLLLVQDFKMKAFLSLVAMVILIVNCFNQIRCLEEDATLQGVFDECMKKHRISKEAVDSIINQEDVPDDYAVKCWLSCVMNHLGMIKDGKINWEHSRNITKQDLISEVDRANVDKIVEICQAEVSQDEKDECQLAFSAAVCKIKNWNQLGLPKSNMEL